MNAFQTCQYKMGITTPVGYVYELGDPLLSMDMDNFVYYQEQGQNCTNLVTPLYIEIKQRGEAAFSELTP